MNFRSVGVFRHRHLHEFRRRKRIARRIPIAVAEIGWVGQGDVVSTWVAKGSADGVWVNKQAADGTWVKQQDS